MEIAVQENRRTGAQARALTRFERFLSVCAVVSIAGVWGLAAALDPDPRGLGTHEQLGLGSCQLMSITGVPCMFCGMTTSFTHFAHGDAAASFITQPAGFCIALFSAPLLIGALVSSVTGRLPRPFAAVAGHRYTYWAAIGILTVAWLYKIAQTW